MQLRVRRDRSRAIQIGMNLSVLEEWVVNSGLPHGVESHFSPVRELLHWLQVGLMVWVVLTLMSFVVLVVCFRIHHVGGDDTNHETLKSASSECLCVSIVRT